MVRQMRLTDLAIRALQPPKKGAQIFCDDLLPGFGVRVSEGGTKSFVLTHGPRRQRETLGKVGILGLSEARSEAKRRLAEYTLGKERVRSVPWSSGLETYLSEVEKKCKFLTHSNYAYVLRRHFKYGDTPLDQISPYDITRSLDRIARTPAEHQRAYTILRAFLRWAHRKHLLDKNPMERMQEPRGYRPRERVLTDQELNAVWLAAKDDTFGRIVKLLILTGQRRGEITNLTAEMVHDDCIVLPSWLTKNSREHTVPIGPLAKSLLSTPHGPSRLYFPALGKDTPFNGYSKCKPKLEKRCGVQDWTLHDLRRTFATGMASIGVSLPVVERLLNHVSGSFGGIVGVYQRYDFLPEMREAIIRWEAYVTQLTN